MSSDTDDVDVETSQGWLAIPTIQRTIAKPSSPGKKKHPQEGYINPFI